MLAPGMLGLGINDKFQSYCANCATVPLFGGCYRGGRVDVNHRFLSISFAWRRSPKRATCQKTRSMVEWRRCSTNFAANLADMVPHNAGSDSEQPFQL